MPDEILPENVEIVDWRKNRAEKKALREKMAKEAAPVAIIEPAVVPAPVADKKQK